MKYHIILIGFLVLQACKPDDNSIEKCSKGEGTFNTAKGTSLILSKQQWYLQRMGKGGQIHFQVAGSTNGDKATIRCYGDGMLSSPPLTLNANKEFDEDIVISFTATAVKAGDIIEKTIITVYKGTDTLNVNLESCTLRY